MSITLDDDFDYTIDERRDAEDDGPALRPGYAPPPPLGEGTGAATFGTETVGKDSEPFLTLRDPSRSTIDWNRFVRPATPEEIKAYDEWEERRAKQGMGAVISQVFQDRRQAWEQTPDQAAHRMWLERQTGIPQRMLQDGDVLRTAEMRAQMGMDALTLHDAPEQVVSWLKTPGMLEIARDDLETLKKAGDALQRLAASKAPTRPGGKWKDLRSGIADVLEGKADAREMQAAARMSPSVLEPEADVGMSSGVMGLGRGFLASLPKEVRKDVTASMSRAALSNADEWRSWAEWVRPEPYVLPKEGTFSRWLSDVVRGTPYTLTGMPVSAALTTGGAVLGGPLGATAGAALSSLIQTNGEAQTEQAQVWKQLVDQGMDPAEAYDKSFNEVYLPNFGLLYLSNFLQDRLTFGVPMGRGAAYWAKRGGNLLLSSLFEGGEEIGQSLISNRALGEENDWGQLLYEGAVGVGVGLVFSGGGTALDAAMGRYREHRAEADAARESTRIGVVMDEAVKAAEASKVRERSPEAFDDFVEYVGGQGQEKVNVDGAVFFQTFGEDAYAAAERLGIAEGLDEAARTGGAVEIPTAAILKNPDLYEKVKNDLRYSDDGMSRNEAQEYERTRGERNRADIDAAASAVRTVQEAGEKAERIRDGLRSQFEALGHKKVGKREAEFYSTIWTAAIANEARYAGVDIEEMAHRPEWNLRFQYDRGAGDISRMRDVYTHPVNVGVNLGQKVPILDLSGMEGANTPKELLTRLKDMALKDEAWISRDAEVFATLPKGKKLRHIAYSSRSSHLENNRALRNGISGNLDELVQNAVLIESVPNNDPKKTNVLNFHRLYVPVRTNAGIQTVRIVAEELKGSDRLRPTGVELYDVILEGEKESPDSTRPSLAGGVVTHPGAPFELTIADMLRGVKDAGGRPYVGEEYQQSSVRQSEDYDPGDPKTWPEGPGRDEALALEAWQNLENDDEIEAWPESPEKARALELQNESRQIDAWIENLSREEFNRRLRDDDPEFVWKNERGVELEKELRSLRKGLLKRAPKNIEKRLSRLIGAEIDAAQEEALAADEAEEYYQTAYHGSPRQSEDYDPGDPKTWPAGAARDEALNLLSEIEVLRMGAMHPNTWQDTRRAREAREIRRRKDQLMSVEGAPHTWMESSRREDALAYLKTLDEDGEVELDPNTWMEESPFKQEALEAWGQYTELGEVLTQKQELGEPLPQKSIDAYNKVDELLWMLRAQEQGRVGERLEDLREEEFNAVDEEMDRLDNRYSDLEDKESRAMLASAEPLQDRLETLISAEEEAAAREAETYYQIIGKRGAEALDTVEEGTARLDNLNVAREMEQAGKDAKAIRLATGWERGADGKWRYEIPDGTFRREGFISNPDLLEFRELEKKFIDGTLTEEEQARLKELEPVARQVRKPSMLSDFYDAPELYAAYPELADVSVKFQDRYGEGKGSYSPSENTILLDTGLRGDAAKTVLVHEIQHAIQNIEGFASGGSPSGMWLGQARKHTLKVYKELRVPLSLEEYAKNAWQTDVITDEIRKDYKKYLKTATSREADRAAQEGAGKKAYRHLGGEVEARNAEKRTHLSDAERRERLLAETEDVAREDQIILKGMMEAHSRQQLTPAENIRRAPLTFKLTGKPVSEAYMAALEKLEAGEPVAAEEYNAIPEIQDARSRTATGSTLNATDREPIRKQVYDKLMSYGSAVTEVVDGRERTVYNGEVRNDHRADIIIGLPASGKSSALVDPISSRYKSMFVDSDEAKKLIPEFDDGFGAGYVHEESKRIVTTVLSDVTDEGKNIVVPIVGSDYIKLKRLYIDGLRQKGYKVYVHMADINPNVAAGRNLRRFAETGRFVDLAATSFKYGNKPREVFERVKKEGIADGYSRIDTTVFPGRQVEGTEDISHDRGDLRERRGRSLSDVHAPGEGESSQTGAAGGGGAAAGLGAERAGGTSREGTAPRGVSGRASGTPLGSTQFTDAETIVTILRDGNRSTFLHELGHVFLNSRKKLALMEGVDDTVRQDWATLVEWLEVADIDFSKPLSETDEKRWRNAHEKFAAGFEKYMLEGRAPNLDLARAFRAFRKWLTDIYKAVRNVFYVDADGNRVEFEINDEIRGVMDRMLASEEEIEESRAVQEAERLAHILTEQGIPDDVAERYRDAVAAGADAARAKLYKKLTAELKAEKQAELKEARKAAHKQAGAEVWDLPEYRALKALLTPRDKGGLRLSMPELIALYGDAGAEALARELPVGVLANDGLSLAEAVELLGYGTPEALLEDLKRAKSLPPQKAVADRVRAATAQLESLIHDPEALRAEAERIMHGRERLEWLALETEMLDEAAHRLEEKIGEDARREERERRKQRERDQNRRAEEDLRGVFGPENLAAMAQAAEAEAERIIAGKRMRDISVSHYMAAEKRASAKALQAAASARFEEARQWKRTELINHALAIEAMNVRDEYEKGRKLLERYWPNRRRLRGVMGNEAFNQVIGLLERLGVNPEDPGAKDRPRLDEYLNDLAKKRETMPPVARWLRDLDIRDARASLANLNPEQFEDVTKAVTALDRIGRLENKLLTAQRNETFAETVERLRAATEKHHGLPGAQSRATDQKGVGLFAGTLASLDRVETLLRQADGLEEQGPFWETIYLPAQRAYEAELVKGKAAKEAIKALLDKHFKDKKAFTRFLNEKLDTGMIDPGTGKKLYWTGENLLCAMLNWGNQHNRERLVYGNGLRENAVGSTERPADDVQYYAEYEAGKAVAEAIFNRLSNDAMWDFCQDVWDYLDTFWPEIQALEERLNGAAPEKVEATPIRTASGKVLRGGYYPVRFDANADWMAFVHNEQESVKALYEDQTHRPGTRKGHTKERVERVAPRQLLLSLDVIAEHTANVVHDLTHREAVRDLYKLIHDDAVRGLLTHAVGRAGFEQFSPWVQSLAAPSIPTDKADRVFSKAMGNAAAVQLGLNMVSSVGQTVSLVPAAWKLGVRRVVPAVLNTLTLRGFWDSKYRDFAFALSPELADRINGTDRNIRAALDLERSGARKRALSGAKAALYVALGWADMAVSLPVWHAAYEKGMARWNDQRKAVDYANYVVRTTNNAGAAKDLAQVQRGGPTRRLFTMYYSAFGSLYQMFHEQMTRAGREGIPGKIKLAAFCFMMFTVQSALEDLVKGRAPLGGDDDDDKSVGKWLIQGTLLSASSMFPIVRDIASGTTLLGGTGKFRPSPALEAGSAFIKAVDSGAKVVTDAWNGEDVEAERVVKNMVEAGGYAFGLPSVQLLRWYKTFVRWANGEPDWSPWELIWHKRGR